MHQFCGLQFVFSSFQLIVYESNLIASKLLHEQDHLDQLHPSLFYFCSLPLTFFFVHWSKLWTKTTDCASLHSCRNVMFLHLLFMIQYNAKSRIGYKCIPAVLQETALCQELYSHPALSYVHPESCGGVYKGCYSVLKRRHQPLHTFHSKIMMLGTSASCLY